MKTIFVLTPHSFVDVITNSSSELFVCDTKKSLKHVKELLQEMLLLRNKCSPEYAQTWEGVFGKIYVVKGDSLKEDLDYLEGWGIHVKPGQIIIESASDNSIPYEIFGVIEKAFNAQHHHLG